MNIWNARPENQSAETEQLLSAIANVKVYSLPVLAIKFTYDSSAEKLIANTDALLFVSKNAVLAWHELGYQKLINNNIQGSKAKDKLLIMAIGDGTAEQLQQIGLAVDYVCPTPFSSETLVADIDFWRLNFTSLLLIGGEGGRSLLCDTIAARQKNVKKLVCYRRDKLEINKQFMLEFVTKNEINAVLLTSVEITEAVVAQLNQLQDKFCWQKVTAFALSQRVAKEARKLGFLTVVTCSKASQVALIETVKKCVSGS